MAQIDFFIAKLYNYNYIVVGRLYKNRQGESYVFVL